MEISLEEAFLGAEKEISIPSSVTCEKCHGHGTKDGKEAPICQHCHGSGHIRMQKGFFVMALSAIKWRLIRKKDYEFASLMDALSNYYRIVLNKGNSIITIENEINMIKEYVRINRFLQENAFEFSVVADTEVLQHHIFKLLLQPFVENSIKHGIANRRDGKIVLEVQDLGEDIRFIITDNGYGMSEEVLSGLLNNTAVVPNSGGYGLYNTQKRIRNCYGDNYGIMIKSAVGEGTVVTVTAAKLDEEELKKRISI